MIVTDEHGTILKANRTTNALLRTASPLVSRHIDEFIPDWPQLSEGKLQTIVGRLLRLPSGESIPVDVNIARMTVGTERYLCFAIQDQSEKRALLYDLHERVKEKATLLNVSEIFSNTTVDDALRDCLEHIRNGWQRPAHTAVKITLNDGRTFSTANFEQSQMMLAREISNKDTSYGTLEVHNLDPSPDASFLKEEEDLIQGVARKLAVYIGLNKTVANLTESESTLRNITEQLPGNTYKFEIGTDGELILKFVSWGQNFPGVIDITQPRWYTQVVHPDDVARFHEIVRSAADGDKDLRVEYRLLIDGKVYWRLLTAKPSLDVDGKVYWYGYSQDITAIVEYISTLEQILFDIAHVMRRPVTTIQGLTQLIDLETLDEQLMRTLAGNFREAADEMEAYMRRLSDVYQERLATTTTSSSASVSQFVSDLKGQRPSPS